MNAERKQAVQTILSILCQPLALLSRPSRDEAYELADRYEIIARDLLDAAVNRSKQA